MKSSLNSSSQPRSVVVGDLNNDHQMDIIVANSGRNTIGVFLSKGDGTFANQQTYSTGSESHPYSIAVSDFNNDNYLDIAVANYGTNNIGIFLGNGRGAFSDQNLISLGSSHPLFVTVTDFNNDHRTDIAVVNYGTNDIGILLGYGNGYFQNQTTYFTGYDSIPYSLAVGDFNKDNQLDIAVANYGTNNVGIFFGYVNGTFSSQQNYTTTANSTPSSIAIGDFNNDNLLDIVVANNGTGNIGLFLGQDNGTFLPQTTYPIGSKAYPQYITVGDLNKDNELDIVIVDSQNDQVHVLLGYGNGSFANITTYDTTSGSSPFWIAVADFNNSNQSYIVVANYGTNNVLVLIDYSRKPSARQKKYHVASSESVVSVADSDFNNDTILDIIVTAGDFVYIRLGLGNGTFGKETEYWAGKNSAPQYICVGDLNNDNKMDIVSANLGSDCVGVFLGNGDGTFTTMMNYSTGKESEPWWVALGDVNNDNVLDIVSANIGSDTVGILLGNGDGTFATVVNYSTLGHSLSVAVGDIDNDNHLDLVVTISSSDVRIFLGLGDGSFIIWNALHTGQNSNPRAIALADLNSDNHLDIIVANTDNYNVGVFLGYGNRTFTVQTTYSTGSTSEPRYAIVADFNNDNISDIAATNFGTDEVVIFYGYGNGSFKLSRNYSTGFGSKPYGIIAADLNNDKQLEIVVALSGDPGNFAVLTEYDAAEFVNQTKYSTGSAPQPYSVAVGDFNNDNRSDIVVANSGNDSLGILFGMGNGTFDMKIIYPIGTDSYPQYVMTCDINKDNQLDIVSVNSKDNSISVIMGYGNGTFAEQLIYSTGDYSHPSGAVSSDFNNDTHLDLVIANEGTDSIGILYGFNYTTFYNQVTYSNIDSSGPFDIVASDFNNDKYLDIAATFFDNGKIGILLGYGNGSFTDIMIYSTGNDSHTYGIAVGDFNNDNQTDIVVTNTGTNTIDILLGYGNGSFAATMTYLTDLKVKNSFPVAVTVGDFNNDGRLDIVVANRKANNVGVLLGYGNGSFFIVQTYSTGPYSTPYCVTVGDFDNDDRLDIAVANFDTDNVGILLGYGNGTFKNVRTFSVDDLSNPLWITVGDFNSDNQLDIATANHNDNSVGILLGYGNGTFSAVEKYLTGIGSKPRCVKIGDFNNDNISDIAVANYGTKTIVVLFGLGDGSFLLGKLYSTGIASNPYALAIGDFNNDSRLDITVANSYANNIGIFLGHNISEPFAGMISYTTEFGSQPHSVAIGDLNNDGSSDIVVANYCANNVGILLGHNNGDFATMITYLTGNGSAPYSVAVADFNNDHHLDIVVTNSETDNITIFLGYGNGAFAVGMTYSTGARSRPYTVAIADFNNDNRSDIVIANSGTNNIFLLYGYGNGTFGNDTSYPFGYGYQPYSVAVSDLNQNNWMDIVIACYDTDHIEVLMKICE
jgi:hypothetical protein